MRPLGSHIDNLFHIFIVLLTYIWNFTQLADENKPDDMETDAVPLEQPNFDESPESSRPKPDRKNRLAALAQSINNWEDDLSHPTIRYMASWNLRCGGNLTCVRVYLWSVSFICYYLSVGMKKSRRRFGSHPSRESRLHQVQVHVHLSSLNPLPVQ